MYPNISLFSYQKGRSANNNLCVSRSGPTAKPINYMWADCHQISSKQSADFKGGRTGAAADGAVATAKNET